MLRFLFCIMAACGISALAGAEKLSAQLPLSDDTAQVVVVSEKSPLGAAFLEYLLPTAGYAYAGDWRRGVPSAAVRLIGFAMIMSDVAPRISPFSSSSSRPCEENCKWGLGLAAVGTVWAMVDAARTAQRENRRHHERTTGLMFSPDLRPAGLGARLHVSISTR